jgi:hypothetical protein
MAKKPPAKKPARKNPVEAKVDHALGIGSSRPTEHPLIGKGVRIEHIDPDPGITFGEIMAIIDCPPAQGDLVLIERVYPNADQDSYQFVIALSGLADPRIRLFNDPDDAIAYTEGTPMPLADAPEGEGPDHLGEPSN